MAATATYIYCLIEQNRRPAPGKAPRGLPGAASPDLLEVGKNLWGVSAAVPMAIYGPEPLEARLRDIKWVADIAMAHEAVVEHFARSRGASVVPMKLFTMFSSPERAVANLRARRAEVVAILRRIRGCEEWGIRVTRRRAAPDKGGKTTALPTSGTAFLVAKKQARDDAREEAIQGARAAETVFASLAKLTRSAHRRPPPEQALVPPLLDAAFLVPSGRRGAFRAAVRTLAVTCRDAGAELTLTGPWPAYNFVNAAPEP
jgi:Gas vesicle synthesis protein GvpL/GvpF